MAKKKKRKERPFQSAADAPFPPPDNLPECGVGKDKQIDVHDSKLFDVAARDSGVYFRELDALTKKLNQVFARDGRTCLSKKQKELGDRSIQLTIALYKGGLYLTYARPARKRTQRSRAS
jgi:hypothetical protein